MTFNFENIVLIVVAVIVLFGGIYVLRFFLRYVWKVIRIVLAAGLILLILGHFLGFINLPLL